MNDVMDSMNSAVYSKFDSVLCEASIKNTSALNFSIRYKMFYSIIFIWKSLCLFQV